MLCDTCIYVIVIYCDSYVFMTIVMYVRVYIYIYGCVYVHTLACVHSRVGGGTFTGRWGYIHGGNVDMCVYIQVGTCGVYTQSLAHLST